MSSYSFAINSPWWVLVLILLSSISISVWYYSRTVPAVSSGRRIVLTTLRFFAIALLLLTLVEPILSWIKSREVEPTIAVLLDESQSMTMADSKQKRSDVFRAAFSASNIATADNARFYAFESSIRELSNFQFDSLKLKGQTTNIQKSLRYVGENSVQDNTQAVVLFTDGAYNAGTNPLAECDILGKPVFVVGIGDSTEPKDISVQSITTNEILYLQNATPIHVSIKQSGCSGNSVAVQLLDNGEKVAEKSIVFASGQQFYSTIFDYKPLKEGSRKLSVVVDGVEGEFTKSNNAKHEYVNVLKEKRKIVVFAGAPSSDLSFIRNILENDKSIQVQTFVQKQGSEFYDKAPTQADMRSADVIVFIGYPIQSTAAATLQLVQQELQAGKSLLFVASQQTDYAKLSTLDEFMPFTVQTYRPQEMSVFANVPEREAGNAILRLSGSKEDVNIWNQLPPVFRSEMFVRTKPDASVLATVKVQNVELNEPFILSKQSGKSRTLAVLGYGLYRWKLLGNAQEQSKGQSSMPDVLNSLVQNSTKWLANNNDKKQVRIKSTKKFYAQSETVELTAQVYDAAFVPVENATVSVQLTGPNEKRAITLNSLGAGNYSASIQGLKSGDCYFSGTAISQNKNLGSDAGRFSIGDVSLEYQNVRMNVELLRSLAQRSGAKFYTNTTVSTLLNDIQNHKSFAARTITSNEDINLWNLSYILAAALTFFAAEWFMRKRLGMV